MLSRRNDDRSGEFMADKEMDIMNDRDLGVGEDVIGDRPRRYQRRRPRQVVPEYVDWKDVDLLRQFVPERGKILARRISGISAKDQRRIAKAIKRARSMALLPFVAD
jgi:small subunit ribosomal protein S18